MPEKPRSERSKQPEPSVIWNEERHVFIKVGPDAYQHCIRELTGQPVMFGVEKIVEQRMYTLDEAKAWVQEHNPSPISEAEVYAVRVFDPGSDDQWVGGVNDDRPDDWPHDPQPA